jgi:hypothetical protein
MSVVKMGWDVDQFFEDLDQSTGGGKRLPNW